MLEGQARGIPSGWCGKLMPTAPQLRWEGMFAAECGCDVLVDVRGILKVVDPR